MSSLLGRLLPLFSGPRRVEDLFTEAVAWLFERRPELCFDWLKEEGLLASDHSVGGEEGYLEVTSQKWLGSLDQQDKASRVDLLIKAYRPTAKNNTVEDEAVADVVMVESKVGSKESPQQLKRYARHLEAMESYRNKALLYITRSYDPKDPYEVLSDIDDVRFKQPRWRDFYRFLNEIEKDAPVEEVMSFMEEQGMGRDYRFSADDLIALSGLPRVLDILEETIDVEVRDELARFSGNGVKRTPANILQQIRGDEGYFIYASLDKEANLECYLGYALRYPDGYPRLQVGLYADPAASGSATMRAAIERIARLEGWEWDPENTEAHEVCEVWREVNLVGLLEDGDHVVAAKNFFIGSIRQLNEELTAFKEEHPSLPWSGG